MIGTRPKVGVSLSGGAAFGLAHVGVLQYFKEQNFHIDAISGVSAGALVAALYAFGKPVEEIYEEACKISWKSLSNITPSKLGPISNKSLGELVLRMIGDRNIEDALLPLSIVATDIRTGEQVVLTTGSVAEAVRASTAIPGIFTPVVIHDRMLVDGGLSNNLPYLPLIDLKCDVMIGVDVLAHSVKLIDPKSYIDILANTYNIFMHKLDYLAQKRFDVVIDPILGKRSIMDFSKPENMIQQGYQAAQEKYVHIEAVIASKTQESFWSKIVRKLT